MREVARRWRWMWLLCLNWGSNMGGFIALALRAQYAFAAVLGCLSCVWLWLIWREWRVLCEAEDA